ncbi:MAG TPA: SPOR domain-containing protein [Thermodesulfobacteriota bacterium]|nr:SPOR domain-containing protein [Thermodesulfobacteriota bacterium]
MAQRKKTTKGNSISISFSLVLLIIGFILGVYASPRIENFIPGDVLTQFGIKRDRTISQIEPTPEKETTRKDTISEEKIEEGKGKYTLQIAVFEDIESALGLADTLNTRGYSPYIQFSNNSDRVLYQLRLGFWISEEEANKFVKTFEKDEEMKSSVVKVK